MIALYYSLGWLFSFFFVFSDLQNVVKNGNRSVKNVNSIIVLSYRKELEEHDRTDTMQGGGLCENDILDKCGVVVCQDSEERSAETFTLAVGSQLGIPYDKYVDVNGTFPPRRDSEGKECENGFMDRFGDERNSWSRCSDEELQKHVDDNELSCLELCKAAENESRTTTHTTMAPSTNVPVSSTVKAFTSIAPSTNVPDSFTEKAFFPDGLNSSTMKATDSLITTTTPKICKDIQFQLCDYNAWVCYYDHYYRSQCEKSCKVCWMSIHEDNKNQITKRIIFY